MRDLGTLNGSSLRTDSHRDIHLVRGNGETLVDFLGFFRATGHSGDEDWSREPPSHEVTGKIHLRQVDLGKGIVK